MRSLLFAAIAASLVAGCGGKDPSDSDDVTPTPTPDVDDPQRLLPMAIGATWTFRVTDAETGAESMKTRTIEAKEDIGDRKAGIEGWRMKVENANGWSLSWHEDLGLDVGVVRHRETSYDLDGTLERDEFYEAHKLRVDETPAHRITGATWTEEYTQTKIKPGEPEVSSPEVRNWYVIAAEESVTVPAGTFTAIRVHRTSPGAETDKTYWFVEGIGTVKEIDAGAEELELVSWDVPAAP
jgi:hypothetical protein